MTLSESAAQLTDWVRARFHYLRNTIIYTMERVLGIGLGFVVYTALARTYGPDLLGQYSYVQTVMLFAVPFLASGSEGIIVRDLVRQPQQTDTILGSALVVLSVTGLVTSLIPLLALWLLDGNNSALMNMALFTAIGFVPSGFLVSEHLLKKEQRATTILFARAGSALAGAAAKLYLVFSGYPIQAVVLATAAEAFVLTALLLVAIPAAYKPQHWRFSREVAQKIFRQSFPAMVASVTVILFFRTNHLLLAYLSDFAAVGQYALAFQTSQMFLVAPTVAFGAVYPRLVQMHTEDPARYRWTMELLYFLFTAAGYGIAIVCLIGARPLFHLVFGDRFDTAASVLIVLSIGNVFNYSGSVRGRSIDIANRTVYHFWCGLLGIVIVLVSSWFVIPHYGAVGAAWCAALATAVAGVFTSWILPGMRADAVEQTRSLLILPAIRDLLRK
jgi:PST family polysaccharide transporter